MRPVAMLLGVALILGMMGGGILVSLSSFRGAAFTEPHIVNTSGATSVTIVLANDVLDNATVNISVLSNNSGDAPVPYLFVSANRQLTVNGLKDNDTRTLTVTYKVPRNDEFTDITARNLPAILLLGCLGCVVGAVVIAVKR